MTSIQDQKSKDPTLAQMYGLPLLGDVQAYIAGNWVLIDPNRSTVGSYDRWVLWCEDDVLVIQYERPVVRVHVGGSRG